MSKRTSSTIPLVSESSDLSVSGNHLNQPTDVSVEVSLSARPSQVVLEASTSSVTPAESSRTGVTTPETKPNRELEFNYKPLPPVPAFLKYPGQPPPAYSKHNTSSDQLPSAAENSSSLSIYCQHTAIPIPLPTTSHQIYQPPSSLFYRYGTGFGFMDHRPQSSSPTSSENTQMVTCAVVACMCVPILGWLPLILACLALNDSDRSPLIRNKLRRFVLLCSAICIMVGLFMTASYFSHCLKHNQLSDGCQAEASWHSPEGIAGNSTDYNSE